MLKYYFLLRGQGHGIPALDVLNSTAKRPGDAKRAREAERARRSRRAMASAARAIATLSVGKVALRSTVAALRDRGPDGR